jgi:hypothetical protein
VSKKSAEMMVFSLWNTDIYPKWSGSIDKTWDDMAVNWKDWLFKSCIHEDYRWPPSYRDDSFLYLMKWNFLDRTFYKIGHSKTPEQRLSSIRSALPGNDLSIEKLQKIPYCIISEVEIGMLIACRQYVISGEWCDFSTVHNKFLLGLIDEVGDANIKSSLLSTI